MTLTPSPTQSRREELEARLEDPKVAAALSVLLDHADLLAVLVEGLDDLVSRSEVIGASLLDGVGELRDTVNANPDMAKAARSIETGEFLIAGAKLAAKLPKAAPGMIHFVDSGVIDKVIDSDLLNTAAVAEVSVLARGLVRGAKSFEAKPDVITGPATLIRLLRDPDINRALNFIAHVARAIGQELASPPPAR
jgi:uncharacterized protein YjgD (DUF1641 family)